MNEKQKNNDILNQYMFISVMFVSLMVISNLLACKLMTIGNMVITPAVFIYPFSFMFGDILTELYGFKNTTKVIWVGFIVQLALIMFSLLAMIMPYPPYWEGQQGFETVFGTTPQIVIGSLVAFLVGGYMNSFVMQKMKNKFKEKLLWLRTITSSVVGEFFDSIIFVTIAFVGRMPLEAMISMIFLQMVIKIVTEAVFGTPLAYMFINKFQKNTIKMNL